MKISTILFGAALLFAPANVAMADGWKDGTGTLDTRDGELRYVTSVTTQDAEENLNFSQSSDPRRVYTNTGQAVKVKQGQTFKIHVKSAASMKWCHAIIFVDWNRNYSFDDNGEQQPKVGQEAKGDEKVCDFEQTITVPSNAVPGKTRMRIQFTDAWHKKDFPNHKHSGDDAVDKGAIYDFDVEVVKQETVAVPTVSVKGGTYIEDQAVVLTCETPGATIYYTIDGSDPSGKKGKPYVEGQPVQLSGMDGLVKPYTLKAYAEKDGVAPSTVTTVEYIIKKTWYDGTGTLPVNNEARYITSATTEGAQANLSYSGSYQPTHPYVKTGSGMTVNPGSKFTINVKSTELMRYTHAIIFIDWNHNFDFDDEGELVKVGKEAASDMAVTDFTREITVPADAKLGTTRMRIQFTDAWHKKDFPDHKHSGDDPVDKGAVYDFIVNIVEKKAETTYTVAGTPATLFGEQWKPEAQAGAMSDTDGDGTFTWSKENVEITDAVLSEKDQVAFKVALNNKWDEAYPVGYDNNYRLGYLIPKAGVYSFDISFTPATKEIKADVYNSAVITEPEYATFAANVNADYMANSLTAYAVTISGDKAMLKPYEGIVAGGTGVVLKGAQGTHKVMGVDKAKPTATLENKLMVSDGTIKGDMEMTIYVLNKGSKGVGFYPLSLGTPLEKGKCYLKVDAVAGAKGFIAIGGETTGISTVETEATGNGNIYNLAGQRVGKAYKGIVIKNGKKYINK